MALVRSFTVDSDIANQVALNWKQPLGFNNSSDEIIVTRSESHFPMELYNATFPTKATDVRPVEVFRGQSIAGTNNATISVVGVVLTDTAASFPTVPKLIGRFIRDYDSKLIKILDNTATTLTLETEPADGKYIVLPDFDTEERVQENFEFDLRTEVGSGFIKDLVYSENNSLLVKEFVEDEVANLIFQDSAGTKFLIKSNSSDTLFFYEAATPSVGTGMAILNKFTDSNTAPYLDSFITDLEADARTGTGLRNNKFYYYTVFAKPENTNVAQAESAAFDSGTPTQGFAISADKKDFDKRLYRLWPSVHRQLDQTADLEDLMKVFGFYFDFLHAVVDTYKLQDTDNVVVSALLPLSEQTGLPSVGFSIGIDTLRRIGKDILPAWKLKGSKEGIAKFIRIITTWDITNGTGDFSTAIQDVLPNVEALRFFDPNLGTTNTRLTESQPLLVSGGRFIKGLPGIIIPGFFTFREFVIIIPDVALFVGATESFTIQANTTTITDSTATFGAVDGLVGNFLIPNQSEINDIFEIVGNTATSITVRGIATNKNEGGKYVVLSPLNTNRFVILNKLLPFYIPFGTAAGFDFTG